MGEPVQSGRAAGKLIVVGLVVVSITMFVVFLPDTTDRVLAKMRSRVENLAPALVILAAAVIAFVLFKRFKRR